MQLNMLVQCMTPQVKTLNEVSSYETNSGIIQSRGLDDVENNPYGC